MGHVVLGSLNLLSVLGIRQKKIEARNFLTVKVSLVDIRKVSFTYVTSLLNVPVNGAFPSKLDV